MWMVHRHEYIIPSQKELTIIQCEDFFLVQMVKMYRIKGFWKIKMLLVAAENHELQKILWIQMWEAS